MANSLRFNYNVDMEFSSGNKCFSNARYGTDYCPWDIKNDSVIMPLPLLSSSFDRSFADITDERAIDILNSAKSQNKRIGVYWSGGIDSTVMVAAFLKNLNSDDLELVDVFLNQYSLIESPRFFTEFIKGKINYKIANNIGLTDDLLRTHILVDGEPMDKLWMGMMGITFAGLHGYESLSRPFVENTDDILNFMHQTIAHDDACRWFEIVESSISENSDLVITTADCLTWMNFFHITGKVYDRLIYDDIDFDNFKNSYCPWYKSSEYQQWAWGSSRDEKNLISSLTEYKMIPKEYIFDLTKDEYSLHFKIKMASVMRGTRREVRNLMILSDGTYVTKDDPNLLNYAEKYLK